MKRNIYFIDVNTYKLIDTWNVSEYSIQLIRGECVVINSELYSVIQIHKTELDTNNINALVYKEEY